MEQDDERAAPTFSLTCASCCDTPTRLEPFPLEPLPELLKGLSSRRPLKCEPILRKPRPKMLLAVGAHEDVVDPNSEDDICLRSSGLNLPFERREFVVRDE
jgi:hypothetical protein